MIVKAVGLTSEEVRPAGSAARQPPGSSHRWWQSTRLSCLVFTADREARDGVRVALAANRRYSCSAPASRDEAAVAAHGGDAEGHALVFVDLPSLFGGWLADGLDVIESRAGRRGTLVVVCGHDGDATEEVAIRQLGAGLYLPGVSLGDAVGHVITALNR